MILKCMECMCHMKCTHSKYDLIFVWVCPECDFHVRSIGDEE
jgi:hypothetical protein